MLPYRVLIGLDVRGIFMEWFLGSTLLSVCSFGAWENAHCFCHKSCFKTLADVSRIWNSVLPSRQWTDVNSILSTRTARPARFPQRTKCHDDDLEFGSIQVVMTKYQQHASLHFAWDGAYLMAELTAVGENGKISQGPCQPKLQDSTNRFPYFRKRNLFTFRASPQFASFQKPIHSIGRPHVPPELSALGLDTHVWSESSLSFHGRRLRQKWRAQFNANLLRRHRRGKRSCWSRTAQAPHWHVCRKWCQVMGLEHPIHCDPMKSCLAMHILGFWWRHRQFHPFSFSLRNHFGFWSNGKRDMLEVLAWANIFQEEKMPLNWPRHWVSLFCTIVRWKWTCEDLVLNCLRCLTLERWIWFPGALLLTSPGFT